MLPFTKRPGRAEDSDVITKDDLPSSGPSKKSMRPPAESVGEDEMTNIIPSRSISTLLEQQPPHSMTGPHPIALSVTGPVLPAAGRPPTLRPSPSSVRPPPGSMRPPPSSARGAHRVDDQEDEDDGRTVVRGAPKIVKRTNPKQGVPASISPAAVIKATLDSARSGAHSRRDLLPGPPAELLEDRGDFEVKNNRTERFGNTARSNAPPSFEGPPSQPPAGYGPPPSSHRMGQNAAAPSGYPAAMAPHGNVPGVAAPPSSMPAHFMTPQAPYSNPDPPGTAVTSGHRVSGRPAVSWAAALLACGLFVGVAAVAVMQSSDAVADTTASFVDPTRAPIKNAGAAAALPTPVPVTANGVPVAVGAAPAAPPPPVAVAPAAPNALVAPPPVQAPPPTALVLPPPSAPSASAGATVGGFSIVGGFAPVAVASTAAPVAKAPPKAPAWRAPAAAPPKPAPAKGPSLAASNDDEPKKEKEPKKKKGEPDDETKKALEALQKAQLESASSFGKE